MLDTAPPIIVARKLQTEARQTRNDKGSNNMEETDERTPEQKADDAKAQQEAMDKEEDEAMKSLGKDKYNKWKKDKKKREEKKAALAKKKELANVEAKREKDRIARDLAWKKKKAEEAARVAYIDSRTKRYANNGGLYFGELSNGQDKVWGVPEGEGEWTRNTGDTMYDGNWYDGKMSGKGTYYFGGKNNDGDSWKGKFLENELHGLGTYSYKFEQGKHDEIIKREAIYYKTTQVCFCDELVHGRVLKLMTGVEPNIVWVNATVLRRHETKTQLWQLKYQHDHGDCVKWIDLSRRKFEMLRMAPLCHRFEADDRVDRVPRSAANYAPWRWDAAQKKIKQVRMTGITDSV